MLGSDNTSHVKENNNDKAGDRPAWETNCKTLQALNDTLVQREISSLFISDGIDCRLALEFFSNLLGIILNDVVVPKHIKRVGSTSPEAKEDSSPQSHDDGKDTS